MLLFAVTFYTWGCASNPPPTTLAAPVSAQTQTVRETFDPRILKEDLLLIKPAFARSTRQPHNDEVITAPILAMAKPDAESEIVAHTTDKASPILSKVYRVQLLALSNEEAARARQSELEYALKVPVYLEQRRRLFMLQAGDFASHAEAEKLKARAATLGPDYDDAYIVSVELQTSISVVDRPLVESEEDATPLPVSADKAEVLVHVFGWRVLLDQFLLHEEADRLKRQAMTRLNRRDIEVTFKAPWYKVEVGHYQNENDAQRAVEKITPRYPNALKVRSQVLVPKKD